MHNDFVLVGPPSDPAGVKGMEIGAAMEKIAKEKAPFVSRGDDSGTHTFELNLWEEAGIEPEGSWYQESGQGMGATLTIASEKDAYTISPTAGPISRTSRAPRSTSSSRATTSC